MGSPHTIDICKFCHNPVIQWNNTGSWEHLASANMDQAQSRAYQTGGKSTNLSNATLCNSPQIATVIANTAGKTNGNSRTATKKSS